MMELLLTKSLSQLILPPSGLILLGLLGLLLHRKRFGRILIVCSFALFWLLATEPVRDLLLNPLEEAHKPFDVAQLSSTEGVAIALLGGGIYEKAPEFGGRDSLNGYAMMRTIYAAELARKTGFDIYASGGAVLSEESEPEGVVCSSGSGALVWMMIVFMSNLLPATPGRMLLISRRCWMESRYQRLFLLLRHGTCRAP